MLTVILGGYSDQVKFPKPQAPGSVRVSKSFSVVIYTGSTMGARRRGLRKTRHVADEVQGSMFLGTLNLKL